VVKIPGRKPLYIKHLVIDYNGTLAVDGKPKEGVKQLLEVLGLNFSIHVVTSDTYGTAADECSKLPVKIHCLKGNNHAEQKERYVISLGADSVAAIGNGENDVLMLQKAALGITVIEEEGCSSRAVLASDIIVRSIYDALKLFVNLKRIAATLRR